MTAVFVIAGILLVTLVVLWPWYIEWLGAHRGAPRESEHTNRLLPSEIEERFMALTQALGADPQEVNKIRGGYMLTLSDTATLHMTAHKMMPGTMRIALRCRLRDISLSKHLTVKPTHQSLCAADAMRFDQRFCVRGKDLDALALISPIEREEMCELLAQMQKICGEEAQIAIESRRLEARATNLPFEHVRPAALAPIFRDVQRLGETFLLRRGRAFEIALEHLRFEREGSLTLARRLYAYTEKEPDAAQGFVEALRASHMTHRAMAAALAPEAFDDDARAQALREGIATAEEIPDLRLLLGALLDTLDAEETSMWLGHLLRLGHRASSKVRERGALASTERDAVIAHLLDLEPPEQRARMLEAVHDFARTYLLSDIVDEADVRALPHADMLRTALIVSLKMFPDPATILDARYMLPTNEVGAVVAHGCHSKPREDRAAFVRACLEHLSNAQILALVAWAEAGATGGLHRGEFPEEDFTIEKHGPEVLWAPLIDAASALQRQGKRDLLTELRRQQHISGDHHGARTILELERLEHVRVASRFLGSLATAAGVNADTQIIRDEYEADANLATILAHAAVFAHTSEQRKEALKVLVEEEFGRPPRALAACEEVITDGVYGAAIEVPWHDAAGPELRRRAFWVVETLTQDDEHLEAMAWHLLRDGAADIAVLDRVHQWFDLEEIRRCVLQLLDRVESGQRLDMLTIMARRWSAGLLVRDLGKHADSLKGDEAREHIAHVLATDEHVTDRVDKAVALLHDEEHRPIAFQVLEQISPEDATTIHTQAVERAPRSEQLDMIRIAGERAGPHMIPRLLEMTEGLFVRGALKEAVGDAVERIQQRHGLSGEAGSLSVALAQGGEVSMSAQQGGLTEASSPEDSQG